MANKLYSAMNSTEKAKSGYKSNQVLVFKETEEGVTPATVAKAFSVGVISESFDRNQRTETNTLLANGGQPSRTDTGGEDPSGSLEVKCTPDFDTVISQYVIGEYVTKTTLNTAHATSTAYTIDDVAVLSGSVLVCSVAGMSGATAPTITSNVTGDKVTDGTVTWIITKGKTAMYKYDGVLKSALPTAGILLKDTVASGSDTLVHETLGRGVSFTNMTIGKEQGAVVAKTSYNIVAHGALASTQDGYTSPTITATVVLEDKPYKKDDICVTINGVAPKSAPSITMSVERSVTVEDAVECLTVSGVKCSAKVTTVGNPTISGNLMIRMTAEQFKNAFDNVEQEVVISYVKGTGEYSKYTLPKVQLLDSTKTYDISKPVELNIPLNAYGDISTNALAYSIRSFLDM